MRNGKRRPYLPAILACTISLVLHVMPVQAGLSIGNSKKAAPKAPQRWEPLTIAPEIPPNIQSVNFFSGIPLAGWGVDLTGGFGDVAANITQARAFAQDNPNVTVNFIITSRWDQDGRNLEASSQRIAEIMVPGLDSKRKDVVQRVGNINYLFYKEHFERTSAQKIDEVIPKADLAINLSGGDHMRSIMERTAAVAITAEEHSGKTDFLEFNANTTVGGINRRLFFLFNSGVNTTGLYLKKPVGSLAPPVTYRPELKDRLQKEGVAVNLDAPGTKIGFAYTKYDVGTIYYLQGVSQFASLPENRDKQFVIFAKKAHSEKLKTPVADNVKIIPFSGLSDETISSIVRSCDISPLVTGDVSSATGLEAITEQKGVMIERPYTLKHESMMTLLKQVAQKAVDLGLYPTHQSAVEAFEEPLLLRFLSDKAVLKSLMTPPEVWSHFYRSAKELSEGWQITKNFAKYYQFFRLFQHEFNNSVFSRAGGSMGGSVMRGEVLDFLFKELNHAKGWEEYPRRLLEVLSRKEATKAQRVFALSALLKLHAADPKNALPPAEHVVWAEAASELYLLGNVTRLSIQDPNFRSTLNELLSHETNAKSLVLKLTEHFQKLLPEAELPFVRAILSSPQSARCFEDLAPRK